MTNLITYAFTILLWGWAVVTGIAVAAYLIYAVLDRVGLTVTDDYPAWSPADDAGFEQHCAKEQQR